MSIDDDTVLDAALLLAGQRLGLHPFPDEPPHEFAVRLAIVIEQDRKRARLQLAVRVGVSATLAALGLGCF